MPLFIKIREQDFLLAWAEEFLAGSQILEGISPLRVFIFANNLHKYRHYINKFFVNIGQNWATIAVGNLDRIHKG